MSNKILVYTIYVVLIEGEFLLKILLKKIELLF